MPRSILALACALAATVALTGCEEPPGGTASGDWRAWPAGTTTVVDRESIPQRVRVETRTICTARDKKGKCTATRRTATTITDPARWRLHLRNGHTTTWVDVPQNIHDHNTPGHPYRR